MTEPLEGEVTLGREILKSRPEPDKDYATSRLNQYGAGIISYAQLLEDMGYNDPTDEPPPDPTYTRRDDDSTDATRFIYEALHTRHELPDWLTQGYDVRVIELDGWLK